MKYLSFAITIIIWVDETASVPIWDYAKLTWLVFPITFEEKDQ